MINDLSTELPRGMNEALNSTGNRNPPAHLPPELVSKIFCSSVSGPQSVFDFPDDPSGVARAGWYEGITTPQLLSSVCKEWRSIGHSTPELWTHVRIVVSDSRPALSSVFAEIATEEIERSGALPLHIFVLARPAALIFNAPFYLRALIGVLQDHILRWKSVFIQAPPKIVNLLVRDANLPLVCLESFRFRYEYVADSFEAASLYHLAPTRLRLENSISRSIFLTLTRLLELHLRDSDARALLSILRAAPNVEKVFLQDVGPVDNGPTPSPLYHSSITDLVINNLDEGALEWMKLVLPSLTSLSVKHLRNTDELSPFINRSHCKLRSLEIICCRMSIDNLVSVLTATPSLERLDIEQMQEGNWLFYPLFDVLYESGIRSGPKILTKLSELRYRSGGKTYDGPTPWYLLTLPEFGAPSNLRKIEIEVGFIKTKSGSHYFMPQHLDRLEDRPSLELRVWDTCQSPKSDFIEDSRRFHANRGPEEVLGEMNAFSQMI